MAFSWVVAQSEKGDFFNSDDRREGYIDRPVVAYVTPPKPVIRTAGKPPRKDDHSLSIRWEERVASLIAAGGAIWAAYAATQDINALWKVQIMPPGPVEVCALGVLAWLHAKWRRSNQV